MFLLAWITLSAACGEHPDPREILLEARAQASQVGRDGTQGWLAQHISVWLAHAEAYDDAVATQQLDQSYPDQSYREIARIRAQNDDVEGALRMIAERQRGRDSARSITTIATELAEAGNVRDAFRVGRGLSGRDMEDVFTAVASWHIGTGQLVEAESTLATAERAGASVGNTQAELAVAYFKAGRRAEADRTLRAIKLSDYSPDFDYISTEMAVERHAWDEARTIISRKPAADRPPALLRLAQAMSHAGDTASAAQVLEAAATAAREIRDNIEQLSALGDIAATQRALGLRVSAVEHIIVSDTARLRNKAHACEMVSALGKAGRLEDARTLYANATCRARDIAWLSYKAHDIDGALELIKGEANPADVSSEVAGWAKFSARSQDLSAALKIFNTRRVENSYDDGYLSPAAQEIAHEIARRGDVRGALAWARNLPTPSQRACALVGVAGVLIKQRKGLPTTRSSSDFDYDGEPNRAQR